MNLDAFSQRFFGVSPLRLAFGLAVLLAIVGGLFWLDRTSGDSDPTLGALDGQSPVVGEPAPLFALEDTDGTVVSLSDFAGQPVWVNFWATWCIPCREELPDIQALADQFEDDGLVVLEVNLGEGKGQASDFWDDLELRLPLLLDSDEEVADQYHRFGAPNSFFIDAQGVLRGSQLGFMTEEQMRERLAEIGLS